MSNKAGEPTLWKIESIPRYSHNESPTAIEYLDHAPSKFYLDELKEPEVTEYYEQPIKKLNTYTVIEYVSSSHANGCERNSALNIYTYIETGESDCTAKVDAIETISEIILREILDSRYEVTDVRALLLHRCDDLTILINGLSSYESNYASEEVQENVHNILNELNNEAIKLAIEKHEKYKIKKAEEELARDIERMDLQRKKDIAMLTELQAKYGAGAGQ